ncbi:HEAT repeat domain-containing protein [bacterium 1xD42-67]|nr:HEAT repeat domain-containing protein [bacterium 1xD42-67]
MKERLEQAAIAGTGLLGEDFRLQRAAEALRPLTGASPVFGKIGAGLDKLLSALAEERSGLLLDVLALVDAVVYTQGKTGAEGDLVPLPAGGGQYQELSHSQLSPLLTALTGAGGGRMSQIRDTWESCPEWFGDYRVLPALVSGLGDSYGELADLDETILKAQGAAVVPLLKDGFDPAGKKEMARRVEVIAALEGAEATPWLREVLPQTKKDVRGAVILALGADPENAPLLLDLSKTERGAIREAVLRALARQDGEEVREFWTAEVAKAPEHVEFLKDNWTQWASDLAAAAFRSLLEEALPAEGRETQITYEGLLTLNCVQAAILGKSSPAMLDCWRWVDSQLPALSKVKRGQGVRHVDLGNGLPVWLLDSLCAAGPSPLCGLCRELWDQDRDSACYLPHALLAALLTRPAAETYEEFLPYFKRSVGVRKAQAIKSAFGHVFWSEKAGRYQASHDYYSVLIDRDSRISALYEPLDRRWFDLLFKIPNIEDILRRLVPPEDPELQNKLTVYQYRKILEGGHFIEEDVTRLREQGWTEWKGFLDNKVRKDGSMTTFAVTRLLNQTSLTGPEKAQELRDLFKIVQEQHAKSKRPTWPEQRVQEQIAAWEAE